MGMMLRRKNRKGDYMPKVNGKPITKQPKKRCLTEKSTTTTTNYDKTSQTKNIK